MGEKCKIGLITRCDRFREFRELILTFRALNFFRTKMYEKARQFI